MHDWQPPTEVGASIPAHETHGVSVTLPTWAANVGYEEGDAWVVDKIKSGYPRFCIHYRIQELKTLLESLYGRENETCMVFATKAAAERGREFVHRRAQVEDIDTDSSVRLVLLSTPKRDQVYRASIAVLFMPRCLEKIAKQYWQHTGEGISSRHAVYFHEQFEEADPSLRNESTYVEERFGRNLDITRAEEAKHALRQRIAEHISSQSTVISTSDVYLFPTGMTAIFTAHRLCMALQNAETNLKSVCFGFPYTDTLKILEKWGPGAIFLSQGSNDELDQLERLMEAGDRICALFCEFPSNPLLRAPDLVRIRKLANKYQFLVVVDETIGNVCNIDVIPYVDMTVCSLTKIFSGESNVMGGGMALNPHGPRYSDLQNALSTQYEDTLWAEDAIYLERNSRDFVERNRKTNLNAEAVVDLLLASPIVREVYYPKILPSKANFDQVKVKGGGYGGLLSVIFNIPAMAVAFFDAINIHKGPSLGTNFTLACPYTIIAHYHELDFVESCGVDRYLVRISIGLEDRKDLLARFQQALQVAAQAGNEKS